MPVKPARLDRVCVLSPAGGPVAAARGSGSTARRAVVDRLRGTGGAAWRAPGASSAEPAQLAHLLARLAHGAAADHRHLAERLEGREALGRERPQAGEEGVELVRRRTGGRAAPGVCASVRSPRLPHVGLELGEEGGQAPERLAAARSRRDAEISAVRPASRTKRLTSPLAVLERADRPVWASPMNFSIVPVWRPRIRSVSLVSRSAGCARRSTFAEVLRAARRGPAPSSPTIRRKRSRYGQPHDVVDEVDRDRGAGLRDRDRAAVADALVGRARLAVHEVLADERLRPDLAASVLAQVGQARLGDLRLHERERAAVALHDLEGASSARRGRRPP